MAIIAETILNLDQGLCLYYTDHSQHSTSVQQQQIVCLFVSAQFTIAIFI